jgi:hypothetical protein
LSSNQQQLSGFAYWRAIIARWIIVNIACRLSPIAVLIFCMETVDLYNNSVIEDIDIGDQDEL